ncbi:TetR/AcrR family transcriptional regulator [Novosphingobium sp. KACC 22771]|uniref:TetR/AcrR family transcriptional regulator n=1 Tax=Novosphingobium sp. KACC 22771 TaxID=3025670 RepID=UPI002365679A|nr:TetR/AcrR family transcriptional regulator [Novosphingobium sp. KACC 22771]WDF71415.1 TetR/AcrR family transcriptional regulator [Novosphingobium sp. KACC 22771]
MPNQRKAPYNLSEKREMTRAQNMEKIEAAAWKVFSTLGLDGATVRDIVNESEVSAGSFYNYYRTKEALFDKLVAELIERIRHEIAVAREGAGDIETMLGKGYAAFMNMLLSVPGGAEFFERNQHHIRSRLFGSAQIRALLADIEMDVAQLGALDRLSESERKLLASIMFATGTEAIFGALKTRDADIAGLARFLARLMTQGIAGCRD